MRIWDKSDRPRGRLIAAFGVLVFALAVAVSALPVRAALPHGQAEKVSPAVLSAAAASRPVNVLVLLDDSEERAAERVQIVSAAPLHTAPLVEYQQRMAMREVLLNTLKATVGATVGGPDLEFRTAYSVLPVLHLRVHSGEALSRLLSHPKVLSVDEVRVVYKSLAQSLPVIRQPDAAIGGFRGAGTTVAVLDTGVDYTRAAFGSCASPGGSCKVVYAQDFAPNDGFLDDDGHGTNVAATVLGVAPDARIAALDVFTGGGAFDSDILSAINWSIAQKATYNIAAINMSLGCCRYTSALPPTDSFGVTLQAAVDAGIAVVVASGNDAYKDAIGWPAAYSNVISVGAVYDANLGAIGWSSCSDPITAVDRVTCFSNGASFLTMYAPGALITAAGLTMGGTSQATPHVAGAAAVLRAAFPGDSVAALKSRLLLAPTRTDPANGLSKPRLDLVSSIGSGPDGEVAFSASGYTVNEGSSVTLSVTRTNTTATANVDYATSSGTAVSGVDFTARSGTLSFLAGQATRTISIPTTSDGVAETTESFSVALSNPAGVVLGSPATATVTIVPPVVVLAKGVGVTGLSGAAGTERYYSLVVPSGATNLRFLMSGVGGDADLYVRRGSKPTVSTYDCRPFLDGSAESCSWATPTAGTYYVMIRGFSEYSGVALLGDYDQATVAFGASTYLVDESAGSIIIPVTRSISAGSASVRFTASGVSATKGVDFGGVSSGTLTFAPGESTKNISLTIIDDAIIESNETFRVTLSSPSGMVLGSPSSTTVTIRDNDAPPPPTTVALGAASYSVGEGAGSISIPVICTGGATAVSVNYASGAISAISGLDFGPVAGTLNFAVCPAVTNIVIPIIEDGVVEPAKTFRLTLSGPVRASLGSPNVATVTIIDNDPYTLTTLRAGSGSIASTPSGISCGAACTATFLPGTLVNLTATPSPGWTFTRWSGACAGTTPTCAVSMSASKAAVATFSPSSPLGPAVDLPDYPWSTLGLSPWFAQSGVWVSGGLAAQSGAVPDSGGSTTLRTVVTGPGILRYYWRVSSEANFDFLSFHFNGWEQAAITGGIDWHAMDWFIPEGTHTLTWTYSKDTSVAGGADAGWVDLVTFTPGAAAASGVRSVVFASQLGNRRSSSPGTSKSR